MNKDSNKVNNRKESISKNAGGHTNAKTAGKATLSKQQINNVTEKVVSANTKNNGMGSGSNEN